MIFKSSYTQSKQTAPQFKVQKIIRPFTHPCISTLLIKSKNFYEIAEFLIKFCINLITFHPTEFSNVIQISLKTGILNLI